MKRGLLTALLTATCMVVVTGGTALADPGGPNVLPQGTMVCDNGVSVEINPGTATNQARAGWAVDSTTVFIAAYFAVTDGQTFTFVFYDSMKGLDGLTTCTRDVGGGITFIAKGFFTPRSQASV